MRPILREGWGGTKHSAGSGGIWPMEIDPYTTVGDGGGAYIKPEF